MSPSSTPSSSLTPSGSCTPCVGAGGMACGSKVLVRNMCSAGDAPVAGKAQQTVHYSHMIVLRAVHCQPIEALHCVFLCTEQHDQETSHQTASVTCIGSQLENGRQRQDQPLHHNQCIRKLRTPSTPAHTLTSVESASGTRTYCACAPCSPHRSSSGRPSSSSVTHPNTRACVHAGMKWHACPGTHLVK